MSAALKRLPGRPKNSGSDTPVREMILDAASSMFMAFGYETISLGQIAANCGVTKASVYYYFSSKPNLFAESVSRMMDKIRSGTRRILGGTGSLRERLQAVAEAHLQHTHVDFASLMREVEPYLTEEQTARLRMAELGIHEELAAAFQAAIEAGEIVSRQPLFISYAFTAVMMMGTRVPADGLFASSREAAAQIVGLFWHGLLPRA